MMYDSVTARNIPADAPIVAGYINGRYIWTDADWQRFRNAKQVRIQVFIPGHPFVPMGMADVLDVEAGDVSRPEAQKAIDAFIADRRAHGRVPCIYTSAGSLHRVWRGTDVDYWLATLDGRERLIAGSCATQWVDAGRYDVSVTADWWPRDYSQPQEVKTVPNGSPVGIKVTPSGKGYLIVGSDGGTFNYGDCPQLQSLPGANVVPNAPIVDFDTTEDMRGIVMVGADWGVYALGTVEYAGHPS